MQINKILLSGLLCAWSFFSHGQEFGSVKGHLKNKEGHGVAAASIIFLNTSYNTSSDTAGNFLINSLPPGHYTALINGIGYKGEQRQIQVFPGKSTVLSLKLHEEMHTMEEVAVTAKSAVQETNQQAFNVTAVDTKKLQNTTLDLAGVLDKVAGVRVRESGGVGSNFNLSLNGFSGNHVRYFIDGIPMENMGTSFQINNIPVNLAERLEVYKGVVPVWLGSDALGGAINIVTGNKLHNYIDASYSYGSFNTHRTVFNSAITNKKGFTFQLNAFQNYSDNNYKVKVDAADIYTGAYAPETYLPRFHDTYHNETIIANIGVLDKKFADKLLVGITLGKNYKEIQTGARMDAVFGGWHRRGNIIMPSIKYKKENLLKGLDLTFNANYNLGSEKNIDTMNVRYDWYGNKKPNGSNGERARSLNTYKNNNGIINAVINYRFASNQSIALSNVLTTFNRRGTDPLNSDVAENEKPKRTQKNVLGIGYIFDMKSKWSVSVFSKYIHLRNGNGQDSKVSTGKLGYGIAGCYFIIPGLQIKSSYEYTNRMPEAQEIFGDVENLQGNINLLPEQSQNINLGFGYTFAISEKNKFQINGSGIYRYSSNFIYYRFENNHSKVIADNRKGVRTIGADGEIRYTHKRWLNLGASVTYQFIQNLQKIEPGFNGISIVYLDQLPNIPYLFSSGDASIKIRNVGWKGNHLNLGYNFLYVHEFFLYWPSRGEEKKNIPSQLSHDLSLVYSIAEGRYNVSLEVRNITNTLMYDNFSLQKPGRGIYLNFRYFLSKTNN